MALMPQRRASSLLLAMAWAPASVLAFSSGGGDPGRQGSPAWQSCDAIYVCGSGVCPSGMSLVAPPVRSDTYTLRTGRGPSHNLDPTQYVPGELLPLYLQVTRRQIPGKEDAGRIIVANETAKYIGMLVYAVKANDATEPKVGGWEVPLENSPSMWTPPDAPGCDKKALMHAGAETKRYTERLMFRAPPAGTGPITFRALVKQGETNKGAFYWPLAPAATYSHLEPSAGLPSGDLTLLERTAPAPPRPWAYRGTVSQTCTEVCAQHGNLVCDANALTATDTATELAAAIETSFLCAPPFYTTCSAAAPQMSGLGDGLCWYREATCATPPNPCEVVPEAKFESSLRLCPCVAPGTSATLCLANEPTISAEGGIYFIDGSSTPISYGDGYLQMSITAGAAHPLRFIHEGGLSQCLPAMTALPASSGGGAGVMVTLSGPLDGGTSYPYYYGNWAATFPSDVACRSHPISLMCGLHGYMGGQNRLVWSESCQAVGRRLEQLESTVTAGVPASLGGAWLGHDDSDRGHPEIDGENDGGGAPCDDAPPQANPSETFRAPHLAHGARGGSPSRCPSMRAAAAAAADASTTASAATATADPAANRGSLSLRWRQALALFALLVGSVFLVAMCAGHCCCRSRRDAHTKGGVTRGKAAVALTSTLMMASLPGVAPHNWIRSVGSRARQTASTVKPCVASTSACHSRSRTRTCMRPSCR